MVKKIILVITALILLVGIWQFELIKYGIQQGMGQLKIIREAKPLDDYLDNPDFPDSLKVKIRLVKEVKEFAVNELGLKGKDNYTTLYDQQGVPVLWVVTAAPPYEMEAREWRFPLLGSFSYKGFFNYDAALKEKAQLEEAGYDTGIRTVSAWSTLGWFNDPLLSGVLNRPEGELAELIIHELTHTTLFVKDSVDFNENLATFVGNKGAEAFLTRKYGETAAQYQSYLLRREDKKIFTDYVLAAAESLDALYKSLTEESNHVKAEKKQEAMTTFTKGLDSLSFNQPERYQDYFNSFTPNNTFFLSFMRYQAKLSDLERQFEQFDNDLPAYINFLKSNYSSL